MRHVDPGADVGGVAPPTVSVPTTAGLRQPAQEVDPELGERARARGLRPSEVASWAKPDSSFRKRRRRQLVARALKRHVARRAGRDDPDRADLAQALNANVKSDFGSLPLPRLWKGPPKLSAIGPLSVFDPGRVDRQREGLSFPLLTLCEPAERLLAAARAPRPSRSRRHRTPASTTASTRLTPAATQPADP